MSNLLGDCLKLAAGLERDLALVELAQDWERESWMDEEDIEKSQTLRILDVYRDRVETQLNSLEWSLKKLLEERSSAG